MSEPFQVNLTRSGPNQPWGFRLQGGSDFSTALSIQTVNPGSIAQQAGLCAGDSILQIGSTSTVNMEHEQAKKEIMMAGDTVPMVVQRGSVKVWQPKVTPMNELRSGPASVPSAGPPADSYCQKTSLAADKQEPTKINFFNKTARGFPGAASGGGQSAQAANNPTMPVIMNAQYNSPMGMYSANSAIEAFDQQSQSLVGNMDGLSVSDKQSATEDNNNNDDDDDDSVTTKTTKPQTAQSTSVHLQVGASDSEAVKHGPSPTFLAVHTADTTNRVRSQSPSFLAVHADDTANRVRSQSPSFLAVHADDTANRVRSQSPSFLKVLSKYGGDEPVTQRSMSPTLQAIQQEEAGPKGRRSPVAESARYVDTKEGEEIRYRGYTDPKKQSRSFRMLQQEMDQSGVEGQAPAPQAAPAQVSGMRSVRAPTGPPSNVQVQQAQHMTCKGCGSLIVGVFVRIKGDPMHPECFKCANCGKNLKNKGHFTVQGSLFCEPCAAAETQPPGSNMTATAVYR